MGPETFEGLAVTTLIVWVAYSTTGASAHLPRAIYLASDSRIIWGTEKRRWDAGRKIFSPVKEPHVFGYSGDVVFPSLVLGQIVSAIDQGILYPTGANEEEINLAIFEAIKASHGFRHNVEEQDFSIVHIHRPQDWPQTAFACRVIDYTASGGVWTNRKVEVPAKTQRIISLGSGASATKAHSDKWERSAAGGTSRAIFSSFCDAVSSKDDKFSGGVPQITGLYTEGAPRPIGVVIDGFWFFNGLKLDAGGSLINVEWCNQLFQRIDPITQKRKTGARRFARPAVT